MLSTGEAAPAVPPPTAHERVVALFDAHTRPVEYGRHANAATADVLAPGDGVVVALGVVHGRPTMAISYDGSAAGGTHGATAHAKIERGLRLAQHAGAAVVLFSEGGGFRPSEPPYYAERRDLVHELALLSGRVPLVGVAVASVWDIRALELGVTDMIVGVHGASVALDEPGPGSDAPHVADVGALEREGAVNVGVGSVAEAIAVVRKYLDYFATPRRPLQQAEDPQVAEELARLIPDNPRRAVDGRRLTDLVADPDSVLRLSERFGGSVQTSLARVGGRALGLVASHSMVKAGALDSDASDKLARFIRLCDSFQLPMVYLTDVPGILAGPAAEHSAINRHSARPYFAQVHARISQLTVAVRRAYGQGMVIMGLGQHSPGQTLTLVWPSAEFGGMGLAGAAAITANSTTSAQATGGRSEQVLYQDLVSHGSALPVAQRFRADDVIEPGDTRARLLAAVELLPVADASRRSHIPLDPW
ncbi:carboxyl transferase domain-containing protein [Pseudonocardia sp.]|uniref:carboxyl transferase domain-containing protein n=1 Tax=Pseudonocardia sp. TaxID=60912 RepID=UPI003D0FAEE4